MRGYWDERARENAVWYVDTSLDFDHPDMERFLDTGRKVVTEALLDGPVTPEGRGLAVEIGSGLGRVCLPLAEHFERVVGIDISSEMVTRARELVVRPGVEFQVGNGSSLQPIDDGSVDFVLSFTVFQHIPDPGVIAAYVGEAGRVLRPGGVFVFQWNNQPGALRWRMNRSFLALLQRVGIGRDRHGRDAPEFLGSRLSLDRIRSMLDAAALRLVASKGEGSLFAWAWAVKDADPQPGGASATA